MRIMKNVFSYIFTQARIIHFFIINFSLKIYTIAGIINSSLKKHDRRNYSLSHY